MPVELLLDAHAILAEGPVWDEQIQRLYWVDIYGETVNILNPSSGANQTYPLGEPIGAAVLRQGGGLLLAQANGLSFFEPQAMRLQHLIDPEADLPENRFNDGKVDALGRFWVGTMPYSCDKYTGSLYRYDADGTLHKMLAPVGISNGLAWSGDNRTLYYIDSLPKTIRAFNYDLASGTIANERLLWAVPDALGSPDGMCIDSQDRLWIAFYGGACVRCYNPRTGQLESQVDIPAPNVTSCAFGGANFDHLYITTASQGMSAEEHSLYPHAGGIFVAQVGAQGLPTQRFAG